MSSAVVSRAANEILGNGGVHHVAIRTGDFEGTVQFYRDGLGFSVKVGWGSAPTRTLMLDAGDGTCVEIMEFVDPMEGADRPLYHLCLRTTRFDVAYQSALAHGATVDKDPRDGRIETTTGHGTASVRWCYLRTPSGEIVELCQGPMLDPDWQGDD